MRGPHKQYGISRYYQLPDDRISVKQIKAIRKVFYDDEADKEDAWVFIYLLINNKILTLISYSDLIISQVAEIDKIRIETIPLNGKDFDLENDLKSIEKIVFGAVANVDSRMLEPHCGLNPDDFVYAFEVHSNMTSYNPFIIHPQDNSNSFACFSR